LCDATASLSINEAFHNVSDHPEEPDHTDVVIKLAL
jgi:hypothetical protein